MPGNNNLHRSRSGKTDEFYTILSLIPESVKLGKNPNIFNHMIQVSKLI